MDHKPASFTSGGVHLLAGILYIIGCAVNYASGCIIGCSLFNQLKLAKDFGFPVPAWFSAGLALAIVAFILCVVAGVVAIIDAVKPARALTITALVLSCVGAAAGIAGNVLLGINIGVTSGPGLGLLAAAAALNVGVGITFASLALCATNRANAEGSSTQKANPLTRVPV